MRFSVIAVSLLSVITSVTAQSLFARQSPYPTCANPCLTGADFGGCTPSDIHCLCTNSAFVTTTTTCFDSSCTGSDLQTALAVAREICAKVGVTLTSTPSTSATSTSTTSASSVSPSSSTVVKSGASSTSYSAVIGLGAAALVAVCI